MKRTAEDECTDNPTPTPIGETKEDGNKDNNDNNSTQSSKRRAKRPGAQYFDEVTITTVPRWKESELSGDMWRTSAKLRIKCKGRTIIDKDFPDVENATIKAGAILLKATERFLGEPVTKGDTCDQEGCSNPSTCTYKIAYTYDNDGTCKDPYSLYSLNSSLPLVRKFCDEHKDRGDCALEDANDNYTLLEGLSSYPCYGKEKEPKEGEDVIRLGTTLDEHTPSDQTTTITE